MNGLHGTLNPWSTQDLDRIHQSSLRILDRVGVEVNDKTVLDLLHHAGARVDREQRRVRFAPEMVQERLEQAPGSRDRGYRPARTFSVSADCGSYALWDYGRGASRDVRARDLIDVPRLVQALGQIDEAGNLVYPPDVPANVRDLIAQRQMWHHTEKEGGGGLGRCPSCAHCLCPQTFDCLYDMLEVKIGKERMQGGPQLSFFMGVASPLRWGKDVLGMARHALQRGQVVGIGGNCISGMQSPITPAANVALDHAERLSGLCIVTTMDPGARFYFCNHTYMLDMRSADIASGSPEQTLTALLGQKLLEHLGFTLVVNHPILDVGGHVPDAQVGAEKMMYMLLTALGGAKGIGGAGQLKQIFSYEQLVIDNEIAGYVRHLLKGAEISEETLAQEDIASVGIGGQFLECPSTLRSMHSVYYSPEIFCRDAMANWSRHGGKSVLARAHEQVESILAGWTPTFLDGHQLSRIDDLIREACRELAPGWDPEPYLDVP